MEDFELLLEERAFLLSVSQITSSVKPKNIEIHLEIYNYSIIMRYSGRN